MVLIAASAGHPTHHTSAFSPLCLLAHRNPDSPIMTTTAWCSGENREEACATAARGLVICPLPTSAAGPRGLNLLNSTYPIHLDHDSHLIGGFGHGPLSASQTSPRTGLANPLPRPLSCIYHVTRTWIVDSACYALHHSTYILRSSPARGRLFVLSAKINRFADSFAFSVSPHLVRRRRKLDSQRICSQGSRPRGQHQQLHHARGHPSVRPRSCLDQHRYSSVHHRRNGL